MSIIELNDPGNFNAESDRLLLDLNCCVASNEALTSFHI